MKGGGNKGVREKGAWHLSGVEWLCILLMSYDYVGRGKFFKFYIDRCYSGTCNAAVWVRGYVAIELGGRM